MRGLSPSSLSSSGTLFDEAAASDKTSVSRLIDVLAAPRDAGGFGGTLRYCDVGLLLQQIECKWDTDRLDDCWYDMVKGFPVTVVDDMPWAAQCIHEHLHGEAVQFVLRSPAAPTRDDPHVSPQRAQDIDRMTTEPHVSRSSSRNAPPPPPPPPPPKQQSPPPPPSDHPAGNGRSRTPGNARFASPTLSSMRRIRSVAAPSRRRSPGIASPRRGRSPPPTSDDVFNRLIEDAKDRRRRATTPTPAATTPIYNSTTAAKGASDHSSSPRQSLRRASPTAPQFNRPTKSYEAKLAPEPELLDRIEAAAPTPHVERRAPLGPSSYVPPGYVEAVARLRGFAASRNHYQFVDSLRAESPAPVVAERSPILRLPLPDSGDGKRVVDVRLASPVRSRHHVIPRDVPYDDPSRVLIQDVLCGKRFRCRQ
ncbi:hypothetical protein DQ04_02801030 [Trypanosoma grayi]|uniref:hypothetical protein n=1 Tax=Trypanosoma grayi TaxID=71804 RepID=UPI0004F48F13|nr:hypothetical protein DQ04_02801030 [Trypanosoma grayi]KEG11262.1 hypothetical protein DQ04_02801030 [Trypanosoma grayi]